MRELSPGARSFAWLLDDFVAQTPGVREAIAVSADGIVLTASAGLARPVAEQFGAITSGLTSLTAGAARALSFGEVEQIIVEMAAGFLFVTAIGLGSSLGVIADKQCDLGLVAYEMTLLCERAGTVLTPELLVELKNLLSV